jgi:hypothetical protein
MVIGYLNIVGITFDEWERFGDPDNAAGHPVPIAIA